MNHNKLDEKKGPKDNVKNGLVIRGWPPKRWNWPPYPFKKNFKLWMKC